MESEEAAVDPPPVKKLKLDTFQMHSVDVEPEPQDVLLELGLLITEGRRPTTNSPKGFEEGPHCLRQLQKLPRNHVCSAQNHLCIREESFRKHVEVLWRNNIPLCIEVILCSSCSCGKDKAVSPEISPLTDPAFTLLEQWTITSVSKRLDGAAAAASSNGAGHGMGVTNGRSIIHAARSFLHFSQLSAWLALSKGESPKNIMYRVTMLGESFVSKFAQTPEEHEFPTVGFKNHVMKVCVKSLPRTRSGSVPTVSCSNMICTTRSQMKRSQSPPVGEIIRGGSSPRPGRSMSSSGRCIFNQLSPIAGNQSNRVKLLKPKQWCKQGKIGNDDTKFTDAGYLQRRRPSGNDPTTSERSNPVVYLGGIVQQHVLDKCLTTYLQDEEESKLGTEDSSLDATKSLPRPIPTLREKIDFLKSLDTAATRLFHLRTGLPLTSSPAPLRKGQDRFDFDSSLVSASRSNTRFRRGTHPSRFSEPTRNLLGPFEESVLNGRIEPVSTVQGFMAEIGASGSFCPRHVHLPVTVFFYTFCDNDKISTPYLAHVDLGEQGFCVPRKGTVQVTLFNPLRTVIKMFVVQFNLENMPNNSQTFLRQRTYFMPLGESDSHPNAQKWLRYLIHLRFASNQSGQIFLHTDIRMVIFRKSDADTATGFDAQAPHELRSFTYAPHNPCFSPKIMNIKQAPFPDQEQKAEHSVKVKQNKKFAAKKLVFDVEDEENGEDEYGKEYEYEFEPCKTSSEVEIIV